VITRLHRQLALTGLSAVLLAALLGACGAPPPPPKPKPPPLPPPTAALADDKPAVAQSIYVYSPVGKRDPFQNVFMVKEVTPVKVPGAKPTPLQKWSLDRLKLVMTMTGTSSPLAMVEDPEGRGWSVRIGTFVGQNWGKVTSIQRDQIIITETITDHATGRVYPQALPLKVARDASELADFKQLSDGETLGAAQSNPGN
jgi:type IV pilus assembly protein PilP